MGLGFRLRFFLCSFMDYAVRKIQGLTLCFKRAITQHGIAALTALMGLRIYASVRQNCRHGIASKS